MSSRYSLVPWDSPVYRLYKQRQQQSKRPGTAAPARHSHDRPTSLYFLGHSDSESSLASSAPSLQSPAPYFQSSQPFPPLVSPISRPRTSSSSPLTSPAATSRFSSQSRHRFTPSEEYELFSAIKHLDLAKLSNFFDSLWLAIVTSAPVASIPSLDETSSLFPYSETFASSIPHRFCFDRESQSDRLSHSMLSNSSHRSSSHSHSHSPHSSSSSSQPLNATPSQLRSAFLRYFDEFTSVFDLKDRVGRSVLRCAVASNSPDILSFLLAEGGSLVLANNNGPTNFFNLPSPSSASLDDSLLRECIARNSPVMIRQLILYGYPVTKKKYKKILESMTKSHPNLQKNGTPKGSNPSSRPTTPSSSRVNTAAPPNPVSPRSPTSAVFQHFFSSQSPAVTSRAFIDSLPDFDSSVPSTPLRSPLARSPVSSSAASNSSFDRTAFYFSNAVRRGDLAAVQSILHNYSPAAALNSRVSSPSPPSEATLRLVNSRVQGLTPLHFASYHGYIQIILYLLFNGAEVNSEVTERDLKRFGIGLPRASAIQFQEKSLHTTTKQENNPSLAAKKYSKSHDQDGIGSVEETKEEKHSHVDSASLAHRSAFIRYQIARARELPSDIFTWNALSIAVSRGFYLCAGVLQSAGAHFPSEAEFAQFSSSPDALSLSTDFSTLAKAVKAKSLHSELQKGGSGSTAFEILDFEIELGGDGAEQILNFPDENGRNSLFYALEDSQKDLCAYLIENGVEINLRDHFHRAPIELAIEKESVEIIELLIDHGAVYSPMKILDFMVTTDESELDWNLREIDNDSTAAPGHGRKASHGKRFIPAQQGISFVETLLDQMEAEEVDMNATISDLIEMVDATPFAESIATDLFATILTHSDAAKSVVEMDANTAADDQRSQEMVESVAEEMAQRFGVKQKFSAFVSALQLVKKLKGKVAASAGKRNRGSNGEDEEGDGKSPLFGLGFDGSGASGRAGNRGGGLPSINENESGDANADGESAGEGGVSEPTIKRDSSFQGLISGAAMQTRPKSEHDQANREPLIVTAEYAAMRSRRGDSLGDGDSERRLKGKKKKSKSGKRGPGGKSNSGSESGDIEEENQEAAGGSAAADSAAEPGREYASFADAFSLLKEWREQEAKRKAKEEQEKIAAEQERKRAEQEEKERKERESSELMKLFASALTHGFGNGSENAAIGAANGEGNDGKDGINGDAGARGSASGNDANGHNIGIGTGSSSADGSAAGSSSVFGGSGLTVDPSLGADLSSLRPEETYDGPSGQRLSEALLKGQFSPTSPSAAAAPLVSPRTRRPRNPFPHLPFPYQYQLAFILDDIETQSGLARSRASGMPRPIMTVSQVCEFNTFLPPLLNSTAGATLASVALKDWLASWHRVARHFGLSAVESFFKEYARQRSIQLNEFSPPPPSVPVPVRGSHRRDHLKLQNAIKQTEYQKKTLNRK